MSHFEILKVVNKFLKKDSRNFVFLLDGNISENKTSFSCQGNADDLAWAIANLFLEREDIKICFENALQIIKKNLPT